MDISAAHGPIGITAYGVTRPLDREAVSLTGGILAAWHNRNMTATLPHAIAQLEESGTIDNFRRLVGESDAPFRGMVFQDSDLYKTLEATAWILAEQPDEPARRFYEDAVSLLARAQRPDGYLNSNFQRPDRDQEPWSDFTHGHEMYCLGHLIQAAVAAQRALGDARLLDVATRFADLVVRLFGGASDVTCGHPEIEMALIELARATGVAAYRDLASAFIERRGNGFIGEGIYGRQYYQDDVPVREARILRGHAVRNLYLNAGVTDLYLETGDAELLAIMRQQWRDLVSRRMYITGGTGSRHRDEAFGDAYELPSERAYAETCAGIALMQWAWRMHLATGESQFLDELERALYNVVAAGVSDDGRAFFYSNPLQRRPDHGASQQESAGRRLSWYRCACCPPNLARTFASLGSVMASVGDDGIRIALYGSAVITVAGVRIAMTSGYPAEGTVRFAVSGSSPLPLWLRIPGWAAGVRVLVDGALVAAPPQNGWVVLDAALADGAEIVIEFGLHPVVLMGHPRIDAIRGAVAVQRGPVVYCAEQRDNVGELDAFCLVPDGLIEESAETAGLGPRLLAPAVMDERPAEALGLYAPLGGATTSAAPGRLILRPYASWANGSGIGAMRVWIPKAVRS